MTRHEPLLLAITAGITDLQPIVRTDQGEQRRAHIRRNNRRLHEALLSGMPPACISSDVSDVNLPEIALDLPGDVDDIALPLDTEQPLWLDNEQQRYAEFERQGENLVLVAPKLNHLRQQIRDSGAKLSGVVIFTTRRDANVRFAREEPVAIGPLLSEWLRPLCRDDAVIETVEYLQGQEKLEDLDKGINLSALAAARLEAGLRALHAVQPDGTLLLAVDGGLPAVKDFVAAASQLFFPPERIRRSLRTVTGSASGFARPGPTEAVRARRLALHHIRHGGFVEAHAVAIEFENDPEAASWVRPLQYASELIARGQTIKDDRLVKPPRSLRRIDGQKKIRCLISALRTEAALQGGHWPEAINWTISFYDGIFLDAIERKLPPGSRLDDRNRLISWGAASAPEKKLLDGGALEKTGAKNYRYDAVGRAQSVWIEWLDEASLKKLQGAIIGGACSPMNYRNINSHNRLTPRELDDACNTFRAVGLWAAEVHGPGTAFMAQPLIVGAMSWLMDQTDPARYYRDLVQELEAILTDPSGGQPLPPRTDPGFVAV